MNWKDACQKTGYALRVTKKNTVRIKAANGDEWDFGDNSEFRRTMDSTKTRAGSFEDWAPIATDSPCHIAVCKVVEVPITFYMMMQSFDDEREAAFKLLDELDVFSVEVQADLNAIKVKIDHMLTILETRVQ